MEKHRKANLMALLTYALCILALASFAMVKTGFLTTL